MNSFKNVLTSPRSRSSIHLWIISACGVLVNSVCVGGVIGMSLQPPWASNLVICLCPINCKLLHAPTFKSRYLSPQKDKSLLKKKIRYNTIWKKCGWTGQANAFRENLAEYQVYVGPPSPSHWLKTTRLYFRRRKKAVMASVTVY